MTVMLDSFFGVHPFVVRSGLWSGMKPGEKDLYIFLMEESERLCTRSLTTTDAEVTGKVKVSARTLCNARKKLQERGLIRCARGQGNKYSYVICNPITREPYPGAPRNPMVVPKRSLKNRALTTAQISPLPIPSEQPQREELLMESHGLPGVFT